MGNGRIRFGRRGHILCIDVVNITCHQENKHNCRWPGYANGGNGLYGNRDGVCLQAGADAVKNKIGAQFEKDTQDVLDTLAGKTRLSYVRLYDTKSAQGKFLPEQPGDFIVAAEGGHLLECKASEKHGSLRACLADNVSTQQAAAHRLWSRTGNPCWFLFNSLPTGQVELWEGQVVGECRALGKRLPKEGKDGGPLVVSRETLQDLLYNTFFRWRNR
jgi:hypothetical protein